MASVRFHTVLSLENANATGIHVPLELVAARGGGKRPAVVATVNGYTYRGTVMGYDPMVQVVHERDVVDALVLALRPGVRGIFNLRGPGEVPLSHLLRMLGRKPMAVPGPIAESVLSRLWKFRLTSFPTPELDHVRYLCMVDDARARATLGYAPKRTLEETARAVESDR